MTAHHREPTADPPDEIGEVDVIIDPDDHVRGPEGAPATVVVYGDYQCPDTRRTLGALRRLEHRAGDGFRLAFRHFPRRDRHPHAQAAAELAEAAADRGRFWELHERLVDDGERLEPDVLRSYAAEFGIPLEEERPSHLEAGHRYADRVEADVRSGVRLGVTGTPTLFVNGRRHDGADDEATLARAIGLAR